MALVKLRPQAQHGAFAFFLVRDAKCLWKTGP